MAVTQPTARLDEDHTAPSYASIRLLRDGMWVLVWVAAIAAGLAGGIVVYVYLESDVPHGVALAAAALGGIVSAFLVVIPWLVALAVLRLLIDIAVAIQQK